MKSFEKYFNPPEKPKKSESLNKLFSETLAPKEQPQEIEIQQEHTGVYVPIDPQEEIEFIKEVVGTIQGEKGEPGPQGERGEKGEKGDKGDSPAITWFNGCMLRGA